MEHFKSPFGARDLSARTVDNQKFFDEMLDRAKEHRFYSHPFMSAFEAAAPSSDAVTFILTSFYKIVSPFTGVLCSLGGRAPDLRTRFALMDNIYEEMGCGELSDAHPSLYLKMLDSIGVSSSDAERSRTLPAVRRINEHLFECVESKSFAVACAVLASAEAAIPPAFSVLARIARSTFPDVDNAFFDRHGVRDEGHSDDAAMLFSVSADSADWVAAEQEIVRDLDYRTDLLDEWMLIAQRGNYVWSAVSDVPRAPSERPARRGSVRPTRAPSVRPPASHPSVRPPV